MEILLLLPTVMMMLSIQSVFTQDKWVWNDRDSKTTLARADGKGRYGIYEPDIPDEPYSPPVRPPPANLPPLIRPSNRPPPPLSQFNYNNRFPNKIDNIPPFPSIDNNNNYNNNNNNNNRRPPSFNNGGASQFPSNRPFLNPRPPPPPPTFRPSTSSFGGQQTPSNRPTYSDNKDPTNFDKCKCVHSFNCKSPAILFAECDTGKKYCCEKHVQPNFEGGRLEDFSIPDVLVGPGGPIDPIVKQQANPRHPAASYGRLPTH